MEARRMSKELEAVIASIGLRPIKATTGTYFGAVESLHSKDRLACRVTVRAAPRRHDHFYYTVHLGNDLSVVRGYGLASNIPRDVTTALIMYEKHQLNEGHHDDMA
jgi:hypothetical protein